MLETASRPILLALLSLFVCTLALPDKSDFYVINDLLPGVSKIPHSLVPEMHAGQLALDSDDEENGKKLFFWRFSEAADQSHNRLIIWLNGGPGCSSMDGALIEVGPFGVNNNGALKANSGSWNQRGDLLFVDQPAGTGFSEVGDDGKYLQDLTEVASDFLLFLENYYSVFPEDREKDLVLAGESYAGQYIPYIGDAIVRHNRELEQEGKQPLKLKALLIGNGWMAPNEQSLSYIPFSVEKGLLTTSMEGYSSLMATHEKCQNRVNSGEEGFLYPDCDRIVSELLRVTANSRGPTDQQCVNLYDYRLRSSYPACGANWPPGVGSVVKFFNLPGVREALHLDKSRVSQWEECNSDVFAAMTNPTAKPAVTLLPKILEAGVQLVLFNGDKDVICNNLGVQTLISTLKWSGGEGFSESAKNYEWFHEDSRKSPIEQSGFVISERNLTFISVFNASHMVPMDVGGVSRGIVDIASGVFEVMAEGGNDAQHLITRDRSSKATEDALLAAGDSPKGAGSSSVDKEKIQRENNRFTFVVLCLMAFSAVWVVLYYSLREKYRVRMRGFFMDPNNRKAGRPENLPMDQDLEFGDFDVEDFDLPGSDANTGRENGLGKNSRGGYQPVPTSL